MFLVEFFLLNVLNCEVLRIFSLNNFLSVTFQMSYSDINVSENRSNVVVTLVPIVSMLCTNVLAHQINFEKISDNDPFSLTLASIRTKST